MKPKQTFDGDLAFLGMPGYNVEASFDKSFRAKRLSCLVSPATPINVRDE